MQGRVALFFVNAEVSSQGHIWSTAAYVTNYGEKTVPSGYAGKRADVDGARCESVWSGPACASSSTTKITVSFQ